MRKAPFRVAFVGHNPGGTTDLLSRLSPLLLPMAFGCWEELSPQLTSFSPELIIVLPGTDSRSPFPLGVPVLTLTPCDLQKSPAEIEAKILGDPGHPCALAPEARLLGRSSAISRVRGILVLTARNSLPLLLTGENGTGKDLAATVAHELSSRASHPFIAVNCGAIPAGLAETEFFGCVRGAFTGAENRPGFCQQALGGTLFLDEIGELPPEIQSKLLRVLESKEIRRVGSGRVEPSDFRLICATNRDLAEEVGLGRFREDLYYRINVLPLKLPALRERLEDLAILADHFLACDALEPNRPIRVGSRALAKLASYHWPGNLRQLRNVVLRAAVFHGGPELEPHHIEWDF